MGTTMLDFHKIRPKVARASAATLLIVTVLRRWCRSAQALVERDPLGGLKLPT